MADTPKRGEHVSWNSIRGETAGKLEKIAKSDTSVQGHKVKASEDAPKVIVKSEKTGKKAAHKPESVHKK